MVHRIALVLPLVAAFLFSSNCAMAVEVYLFRGAGDFSFIREGMNFSQGINHLGGKLNKVGIRAETRPYVSGKQALAEIRRRRPQSVALIGHSMGANTAIRLAKELARDNIRVSYLGLIDIPGPVSSVPSNVEWAENFYSLYPVYARMSKPASYRGLLVNYFISGESHTSMDNSQKIHHAVQTAIWKIEAVDQQFASGALAYAPRQDNDTREIDRIITSGVRTDYTGPKATVAQGQ